MEFLPRTFGTRPRLACEVRAEGVVAARAEDASPLLVSVSRSALADTAAIPLVRAGDAPAGGKSDRVALVGAVRKALETVALRSRDITLVVPDTAVRVLLLDFDALPAKPAEALPVVRFRLKKMLPFDAEDAAVSYQIMSSTRDSLQVLAVAMPRDVLAEYESIVREAGFEPGAVLPSTLAAVAGLRDGEIAALVVNAGRDSVTTAIVRSGILLLHRTVDLAVGRSESSADAAQKSARESPSDTSISAIAARLAAAGRPAPVLDTQASAESGMESVTREVAEAVSVASAYFEDTLEAAPALVLSAGTLGASALTSVLDQAHVGPVAVQEMIDRQMLGVGASASGAAIPLGWLAGVRGALAV